jgi:hypothetical protein
LGGVEIVNTGGRSGAIVLLLAVSFLSACVICHFYLVVYTSVSCDTVAIFPRTCPVWWTTFVDISYGEIA